MKKNQWFIILGLLFSIMFNVGFAKDENPKIENVEILELDPEAMTLSIEAMTFWIDAKTKIEDSGSNHINFSDLQVGDIIEIWYDDLQSNDAGFSYASKIEIE
jgi:hypothetical protein